MPIDRRYLLRGLAVGSLITGAGLAPVRAQTTRLQPSRDVGTAEYAPVPETASRAIPMPKASIPTLSPQTLQLTERAVAQYEDIVAAGGWAPVQADKLRFGVRHPAVVALRRRLIAGGDLAPQAAQSDAFDAAVDQAVKRFQLRHGLPADGIVSGLTPGQMNLSAQTRLNQLKINAVRLRSFSGNLGPRFVICNIPATEIEAVEGGVAVSRHNAVVGKPDRPSPDIQSRMVEINFNPFWTVPLSIVRRDLIPKMQAEPDYLTKNRIRIIDPRGVEMSPAQVNWFSNEAASYQFKQDPGELNSLGSVRINFPSAHGVYMHDTPYKNLFGEDFRFHSSGCVRVQDVHALVAWLLSDTPQWTRTDIEHVLRTGERKDARMARPVPLYWVYVTAWASQDGVVQFRDDIYSRDGAGPVTAAQRG